MSIGRGAKNAKATASNDARGHAADSAADPSKDVVDKHERGRASLEERTISADCLSPVISTRALRN